jgi:hypothetical protein
MLGVTPRKQHSPGSVPDRGLDQRPRKLERIEQIGRLFWAAIGKRSVLRVGPDDDGLVQAGLFWTHLGKGREDHHVAGSFQVGGRAIDADGARAPGSLERVGHESGALDGVPDMHGLERQDARCVPLISVDGDAPLEAKSACVMAARWIFDLKMESLMARS